ncbi:hypothetical protein FACS1894120_1890 [Clostridia bacterium]|nr:hypothetical protein FACS1894120_1890 [Clostridia bacterium]
MKKIVTYITAAVMSVVLSVSLTACGDKELDVGDITDTAAPVYQTDKKGKTVTDENGDPVTEPPAETQTEEPTAPTSATDENGNEIPPPPDYPLKKTVGFIYRGKVRGDPSNEIFEASRARLEVDLGVDTYYVDNVLVQSFTEAVDTLMQSGCDVIVATSESFANVALNLSKSLPQIKFINYGGEAKASNLSSITPLLYQGANIAGLAAAYSSENNNIGIVADRSATEYAAVVDAFVLGAKVVYGESTSIKLNLVLSDDNARTKLAIDDLRAQGCDTIFVYQSNSYGIQYCEKMGIKVVSMAANLPELAPTQYVVGFFFDISAYLNEMVRYIQNDAFSGKTQLASIANRSVRLTQLNSTLPSETARLTDELLKNVSSQTGDGIFRGELKDINGKIRVSKGDILPYSETVKIDWIVKGVTRIKKYDQPKNEEDLIFPSFQVKE